VRGGLSQAPALTSQLAQQLEAAGLRVDYVELVAPHSLEPLQQVQGLALLATAVHCGSSRLIDHCFLMSRLPIVAIDGPAGAGKSTVTRAFARQMGLVYLDTGAMYRALTWWVLRQEADPAAAAAVEPLLLGLDLQLSASGAGEQLVSINGFDVTEAIRSPEVTAQVSLVAAHGCVRQALTAQQQAMGFKGGLVAEGRDIGTIIFPDADFRFFLHADPAERARRRAAEGQQDSIAERDRLDSSRKAAPLACPIGAIDIDSTLLDLETVVETVAAPIAARLAA
jgi:pantoate ligase/cytidylate kinase